MILTQQGVAPTTRGDTTAHPGDSGDIPSVEQFARTLVETVDVEEVAAMYADDALVIGEYAPGLYHGTSEIRKALQARLGHLAARRLDDLDINVVSNGNMAVAHGQQKLTSIGLDGSSDTTLTRFHTVVSRQGDSWVVLVQHTSFAADLATMGTWQERFLRPGVLHWDDDPFPSPAIDIEQAKYELNIWQIDDVRAQTADQAMHFYGPGDYVAVYDSRYPSGRMVGMWETYQGWLPQMQLKHVEETLAEFRVWTDGQFAAHFTLGNIDASKLDGSEMHSQIRQVDCLHRIDGQWYSFVESVSFPVDESNGRLVMNLPAVRKAVNQAH